MIAKLRSANREQVKLLLSVVMNVLTRVPGAVGVLWFLPLLLLGLGTQKYGELLSSMALGGAAAFLLGGISVVGRRLIGEAYADGSRTGEADQFANLLIANVAAFGLAIAIIAIYSMTHGGSSAFFVAASLPALAIFLNTFDNVRSAYNEHYVTATLQLVLQISLYTVGFLVPEFRKDLILGAMVIQGHYIFASLITLGLLLYDRPYLVRGRPSGVWQIIREGTMLAVADGFLLATLSLSVVWLQATAAPATSAWFATIVRLFQTFLLPIVLLLVPLSSYVRLLWKRKTLAQQRAFTKLLLVMGIAYGVVVAVGMFLASSLYVGWMLHLPEPAGWMKIVPTFLLFGAIVAYRSYSSIAYLVLEESGHLSFWTTAAVGGAVLAGVAASTVLDPLGSISVFALTGAVCIVGVLLWNAARFARPSKVSVPMRASLTPATRSEHRA